MTRSQNRGYIAMLAAVTLLVGLACLLALYYAERARSRAWGSAGLKAKCAGWKKKSAARKKWPPWAIWRRAWPTRYAIL